MEGSIFLLNFRSLSLLPPNFGGQRSLESTMTLLTMAVSVSRHGKKSNSNFKDHTLNADFEFRAIESECPATARLTKRIDYFLDLESLSQEHAELYQVRGKFLHKNNLGTNRSIFYPGGKLWAWRSLYCPLRPSHDGQAFQTC